MTDFVFDLSKVLGLVMIRGHETKFSPKESSVSVCSV